MGSSRRTRVSLGGNKLKLRSACHPSNRWKADTSRSPVHSGMPLPKRQRVANQPLNSTKTSSLYHPTHECLLTDLPIKGSSSNSQNPLRILKSQLKCWSPLIRQDQFWKVRRRWSTLAFFPQSWVPPCPFCLLCEHQLPWTFSGSHLQS